MTIYDHEVAALGGAPADLHDYAGKTALIVNVASKCGLTPQYAGLERLHERYADQGFTVLGVPCNQFMGQEPGTAEEIAEFCSTSYGVSFPMLEKADVNGPQQHPLYKDLTVVPDADGEAGDVKWNFEKFLVSRGGEVLKRYRSKTTPEEIVADIEAALER